MADNTEQPLVKQLQDARGNVVDVNPSSEQVLRQSGYTDLTPDQVQNIANQQQYGTTGQQILTGLEGAGSAATFGLSRGLENQASKIPGLENLSAESQRHRVKINPGVSSLGSIAGLVGSTALGGLGAANALGAAGEAGASALGLGAEGAGLASRLATHATKTAIETALFQSGDEVGKMLTSDPRQTIGTAAANIGLAGILGAGLGTGIGSVGELLKSGTGSNLGQFIEDFKGRVGEHLANPDPAGAISEELSDHYSNISPFTNPEVLPNALKERLTPAYEEYKPAFDDFQKKFTSNLNGERVVDPGKVNSYVNQIGKPNGELKQEVLKNFLNASEDYKNTINEAHAELGLKPPIDSSSFSMSKMSTGSLSPGAKVADAFIRRGLSKGIGQTLGAAIGGGLGHLGGQGFLGALIGEHALGPLFDSVLPSLTKNLLSMSADGGALKGAIDYGLAAVKGENLLNKSAEAIFNSAKDVLPSTLLPTDKKISKLDDKLKDLQADQSQLFNIGGKIAHYMPQHGVAIAQTAANAVNYLNSLRPNTTKQNPLDSDIEPNQIQKNSFDNALRIAQQPLLVLKDIREGNITTTDIGHLNALYPGLYDRLKSKIGQEMISAVHDEKVIPYKTRLGLSIFLGQPLDSTMTPQGIMAAQPKVAQAPQQQQPQAKGPHSMKNITKYASQFQTPGQAREADRTSKA